MLKSHYIDCFRKPKNENHQILSNENGKKRNKRIQKLDFLFFHLYAKRFSITTFDV
jgi:hypothetical protein